MTWQDTYERWKAKYDLDPQLQEALHKMDESEAEAAFNGTLEFGTGGMRGVLGPGTNRMNIYTVRKAAKGLALYLEAEGRADEGVVVAYDSRYQSFDFALETAKVLGVHGIKTSVFTGVRPTPTLSFAVRHLHAGAGVMITASHNPPEYNGYKVYNEQGAQLPPVQADQMIAQVNAVEDELAIDVVDKTLLEADGLLEWIDDEVDVAYLERLGMVTYRKDVARDDLSIVFTPLHGTAYDLTMRSLAQAGFKNVHAVEDQVVEDPEFSTVKSPNPEEHQAFEYAVAKGKDVGADILVATDPDADRLGVAAKNAEGEYDVLTGNQLGALMLDYKLANLDDVPANGVMINTIVTSQLGQAVAAHYGVETVNTLTGFKFIAEKIETYNRNGEYDFVFGYEESYGYLVEDFARDKDALQSTLLACEMAAYYKERGMTLFDALDQLFERHGYYVEDLHSLKVSGAEGQERITDIMEDFREDPLAGALVVEDYREGTRTYVATSEVESLDLPHSNVVKFWLDDDMWCCLRPSGTEPKMKFYFGVRGKTREDADERLSRLKERVLKRVEG
ncbi:phosphoglucomutase [Alkalibacillus flavidus]|uniref:Phosphoglucomutase n=1 Tax=Alkalibacillus flavidus TaxID=546021 RepID=A0ABV2KU14_9BACI